MSGTRDWDAASYDRLSEPQVRWAAGMLDRIVFEGDETVLDAGCGSGRVTAMLAERVPRGRVYAVDVAPAMVEFARRSLGERAIVLCQDLVELELPEPVELIFSNATFHWIADHDALFAALFGALAGGGRLVAQCGGRGNIADLRAAADEIAIGDPRFAEFFADWRGPWNYASDVETARRLENAGFADVRCWLEPRPESPAEARGFLRTVCLVRHLDRLPAGLWDPFLDAVLERVGEPLVLAYVRLNLDARKP